MSTECGFQSSTSRTVKIYAFSSSLSVIIALPGTSGSTLRSSLTLVSMLYSGGLQAASMASSPQSVSPAFLDSPAVVPGVRWFHLSDPSSSALDYLAGQFGIHPLQVEDCRHRRQTARLEEHERYTFVVIKVLVGAHGENAANPAGAPTTDSTSPQAGSPATPNAFVPSTARLRFDDLTGIFSLEHAQLLTEGTDLETEVVAGTEEAAGAGEKLKGKSHHGTGSTA